MALTLRSVYKSLVRRKYIPDESLNKSELERCLTTFDLTFLGVGSTLGLGIYILVGQIASQTAGPAVSISYFIAAVASVFSALCYAEFGARVPKAGSAYVYSYVTVGEFMAFIIGWNLILEYVIGTASVARGYSGYIDSLFGGVIAGNLNKTMHIHLSGMSDYPDFLAFGITLLLAIILAIGVKESSSFNNVCTVLNLFVVTYAVITGCFKADIHNWELTEAEVPHDKTPGGIDAGSGGFFPYGFHGVVSGAATCFYGYVGFDCIATTGEEAKNPQRAIPIAIVTSLFIVFLAYFSVSIVQTLIWPYYLQNVPAPLPYVFEMVHWPVAKWIISVGALAGLSTSLLGAMFPLPRVLYAMAKDGLIFRFLSKAHKKYKTPMIATFISGVFAALMAMFFNIKELADMMSIGTLLAYTLVAVSVLILRYRIQEERIPLAPLHLNNEVTSSHSSIMEGMEILVLNILFDSNLWPIHIGGFPMPQLLLNNEVTSSYSYIMKGTLENSCLDSQSMIDTDNPYYIRNLAKKNLSVITSSTNTLLASTQHYTYKDILNQVFNKEKIEVQTTLSSKVSMILILLIGVFVITMDILLDVLEDDLFSMDIGALTTVGFIFIIIVILVIALALQPCDQKKLAFRVPWVPVVPVLSVLVNFYLMLKLPNATWIRFLVWMIIGFVIYFGYGLWHSSERCIVVQQLPPLYEESPSESDERDDSKTEHSPLLAEKN